ncbi:MAG: hypothetical protein ACE5LB_00795 [Acidiferrobacterales bacterium]
MESSSARWSMLMMLTLAALALGAVCAVVRPELVYAGTTISASRIQQLIATVDRLDRDLARTRQELAELKRRYGAHTHRLNASVLPVSDLSRRPTDEDEPKVLVPAASGDPTLTRGPR